MRCFQVYASWELSGSTRHFGPADIIMFKMRREVDIIKKSTPKEAARVFLRAYPSESCKKGCSCGGVVVVNDLDTSCEYTYPFEELRKAKK